MTYISDNFLAIGVVASLLAILSLGILSGFFFFRLRMYHVNTYHRSNQQIERVLAEINKFVVDQSSNDEALLSSQKLIAKRLESVSVNLSTVSESMSKSVDFRDRQMTKLHDQTADLVTSLNNQFGALNDVNKQRSDRLLEEANELRESFKVNTVGLSDIEKKLAEQNEGLRFLTRNFDGLSNGLRFQSRQLKQVLTTEFDGVRESIPPKTARIARVANSVLKEKQPLTILVAGMRHSGSTALFNAIRYVFDGSGIEYEAGYSQGTLFRHPQMRGNEVRIIKVHEYRDDLIDSADVIFTTRRDIRDTVASATRRKFGLLERVGGAVEYAKHNCMLHVVWREHSDFEFVYEKFKDNSVGVLGELVSAMGFEEIDVDELADSVNNIPTDQYEKTLLTPEHQTDIEGKTSYYDTLKENQVREITANHLGWLTRYGLEVS